MTEATPGMADADDARLLNMVRAGDPGAFAVLYERHATAARQLAGRLVSSPAEVDDVVAEAFARLLEATRRGGGPTNAVRPYLLSALRRVCFERLHGQTIYPADEWQLRDPAEPIADPALAGLEEALIARAYLSLPERWRAVLWHTEIERATPAEVAPLLGLTPSGVAGLRRRAADGLRQAYLHMYAARVTRPECRQVAERLAAYIHDVLPSDDTSVITDHLHECTDCQTVHDELADVSPSLRRIVAPLVLGTTAAAYLSDSEGGDAAAGTAARTMATGGAGGRAAETPARPARSQPTLELAAAGAAGLAAGAALEIKPAGRPVARAAPRHAGRFRDLPRPSRGVAVGGTAALAAVAAIALVLTLSGGNGGVPASANSPASRPDASVTVQASTSAPPSPSPSPTLPSPTPAAPAPVPATLTASMNATGGWMPGHGGAVSFEVTNDGSVSTGTLSAWVSLPPGSSLFGLGGGGGDFGNGGGGGGHGEGTGIREFDGHGGGWSCQAASGGASCTHDALAPGERADGLLFVAVTSSSACGQPIRLTVTSGPVTAYAEQYIGC